MNPDTIDELRAPTGATPKPINMILGKSNKDSLKKSHKDPLKIFDGKGTTSVPASPTKTDDIEKKEPDPNNERFMQEIDESDRSDLHFAKLYVDGPDPSTKIAATDAVTVETKGFHTLDSWQRLPRAEVEKQTEMFVRNEEKRRLEELAKAAELGDPLQTFVFRSRDGTRIMNQTWDTIEISGKSRKLNGGNITKHNFGNRNQTLASSTPTDDLNLLGQEPPQIGDYALRNLEGRVTSKNF
jgi:hypothetical protein